MFHLVLPGDRFVEINAGTVLHLFPGQVDMEVQWAPGGMTQGQGRDQYLASGEDDAGCNNDVADGPLRVIKIEIADGSDICVDCSDRVPGYVFCPCRRIAFSLAAGYFCDSSDQMILLLPKIQYSVAQGPNFGCAALLRVSPILYLSVDLERTVQSYS